MLSVSSKWKQAYPDALCGLLAMGPIDNTSVDEELERQSAVLETELRDRYAGFGRSAFKQLPLVALYDRYYKDFKKTYHVLLQLESVVLKGKAIPNTPPAVKAMFMAELKNLFLTAGHDLDAVETPLTLDVATGTETYTLLNGNDQQTKAGDMIISDRKGIISSVIYGPDRRTRIEKTTRNVVYTVYAPPGAAIEELEGHLDDLERFIRIASPQAEVLKRSISGGSTV
jgi:DNA/RNA-binding domain of Phe-tRNA-synthetase-like protein